MQILFVKFLTAPFTPNILVDPTTPTDAREEFLPGVVSNHQESLQEEVELNYLSPRRKSSSSFGNTLDRRRSRRSSRKASSQKQTSIDQDNLQSMIEDTNAEAHESNGLQRITSVYSDGYLTDNGSYREDIDKLTKDIETQTTNVNDQGCCFFNLIEDNQKNHSFDLIDEGLSITKLTITSVIDNSEIIAYLSKPTHPKFAIIFFISSTSFEGNIKSILGAQRKLTKKLQNYPIMLVSIEKKGINNNMVNLEEFWKHYSMTQIIQDHKSVIDFFDGNPPCGWSNKLIFLGKEEGARIALNLATKYSLRTLAIVSWGGGGDYPWSNESWLEFHRRYNKGLFATVCTTLSRWISCCHEDKQSKDWFYSQLQECLRNPNSYQFFEGRSFFYLADAQLQPSPDYKNITMPLLFIFANQDPTKPSLKSFIQKCKAAGVDIRYRIIGGNNCFLQALSNDVYEWIGEILRYEP